MRLSGLRHTASAIVMLVLCIPLQAFAVSNDRGSRGYWLSKYGEIKPEANQFARRAHDVFRRVLKASDRKKGVEPMLIVINYSGRPWAQSLVDGTIVLTKNALDFCYRNTDANTGDSRLAFVIGHELAHQFNGDFWHYQFFQAAENGAADKSRAFDEIKTIVKDSENFQVKELQADQYGVIYASIAGFDMDAVVSKDTNLFNEWAKASDPSGFLKTSSHPSSEHRAAAVISKLRDVVRHLSLFRAGVAAYYAGLHKESVAIMEEFARTYPSKEVYNNIGTAYLSIAYENYRLWKGEEAIPFRFSFGIDTHTSAEFIEVARRESSKEQYFTKYASAIDRAGEYLRRASESGYDYALSRNNLGCAYMLEGRFHEAVAAFDEALALKPDDIMTLNNRGIAKYYLSERLKAPQLKEAAKEDFKKALSVDRSFSPASYNLALLEGDGVGEGEPAVYSEPTSHVKTIKPDFGIPVGAPMSDEIKQGVKKGYSYEIPVDGRITLNIYDMPERGVVVLERNGFVSIVIAKKNKALQKAVDISKKRVPEKKFTYDDTEVWMYPSQGFGIEFRGKKAVTGFLYQAGL